MEEAVRLGEQAMAFLGGIDCLVNNAGITFNKPFLEVTPEQFDRLYHVNIRAQFFLTQRVVKDMLTHGGGAICNITSIHGVSGAPEHSVYAGTKGAIIAYTRSLAVELAHKGIRVNAIAPGLGHGGELLQGASRFQRGRRPQGGGGKGAAGPLRAESWRSPGWRSSCAPRMRLTSSARPSWRTAAPPR